MQPEKAISNMSCMPWIIGWLLINSKLFCLCTLKYLTRRQNHYQFYGAPVFLIALSRAVNDLPGASNQSTGSMAWREAMEHQFFFHCTIIRRTCSASSCMEQGHGAPGIFIAPSCPEIPSRGLNCVCALPGGSYGR